MVVTFCDCISEYSRAVQQPAGVRWLRAGVESLGCAGGGGVILQWPRRDYDGTSKCVKAPPCQLGRH